MSIFCHENLLKKEYSTRADNLCEHYNLNPDTVSEELVKFKKLYELMEGNIDVSDLLPGPTKKHKDKEEENEDNLPDLDSEDEGEETEEDAQKKRKTRAQFFILKGFIKPFRLLTQLSTFNHLTILYKILVSLAISRCSAERALSKNRIIKNPLRSTMLDEWLSNMMILASEKDVLDTIPDEEIIDRLGRKSQVYARLLF